MLELSPSLTLEQYFAPSSWPSDNANDLDFSTGVALLANGQVVAGSKSRFVYLLNGSSLGGIGGQRAALGNACGDDIDGGLAIDGSIVYLPCLDGPIAVLASDSPAGLRLLWSASVGGGPPILAGGLVWTIGSNGDPLRPRPVDRSGLGAGDHRCPGQPLPHPVHRHGSPAGTFGEPHRGVHGVRRRRHDDHVHDVLPSTTVPHGRSAAPTSTGTSHSNEILAAAVVGALVVIFVVSWLLWRRRASAKRS